MDFNPNTFWYVGLLWPALVVLAILYYRRTIPETSTRARRTLLALRLLVLTGLVAALVQPVFDWQRSRPRPPVWQVLVDYSTSMDRVDHVERSRLESALELARDASWEQAAPGVTKVVSYFAVESGSDTAHLNREGTDLHAALTRLAESPEPPTAVVVLTDGSVNGASDPASVAWPFPVYSVCLGDSTPASDVAVIGLSGPSTAVAGDSVTLVLSATSEGEPGTAVVQFEAGATQLHRTEHFDGGGRTQEIPFTFRPDTAGLYRVRARVAPGRDELTTANNSVESHVYVEPRKRRCLLMALSPDWETAFMTRALAGNDRLDLDVRYKRLQGAGRRPWPATLDSLLSFDAVIVADMPASEWSYLAVPLGRYLSEGGGGVMFLLGPQAAEVAWQPEQEEVLGVRAAVNPPGVMSADEPVRATGYGMYHPVTTAEGKYAGWGDAGRLEGLIPVQEESGAVRLLEVGQGAVSWPTLVASRSGRGRVLAVLGFPLWRSGFAPAAPETFPLYEDFWQRSVVWLSTSSQTSRLTVDAGVQPLPLFVAPELSAVLVDEAWQPDSRATLTVTVRDNDSNLVQTFEMVSAGGGRYQGAGRPLPAGEYRFEVAARVDTLLLARESGPLVVSSISREALHVSARPSGLDLLAAATGGKRLGATTWATELSSLPKEESVQVRYGSLRLWDHPLVLTALLLLLAAEWILRRRFQML